MQSFYKRSGYNLSNNATLAWPKLVREDTATEMLHGGDSAWVGGRALAEQTRKKSTAH